MQQLEIKFFWPLTEQIPLDLDYDSCQKSVKNLTITSGISDNQTFTVLSGSITPSFTIDIDQASLTVLSKEEPGLIRRYIYKIMGIKWQQKIS